MPEQGGAGSSPTWVLQPSHCLYWQWEGRYSLEPIFDADVGYQEPGKRRSLITYLRHHRQPQQVADATYEGDEDFPTETLP